MDRGLWFFIIHFILAISSHSLVGHPRVSRAFHLGVGDDLCRGVGCLGRVAKDNTTLPWWWLGMKTFLLNGEQ